MGVGSPPPSFNLTFAASAISSKSTGDVPPNMQLAMLGDKPPPRISSGNSDGRFHCHPFTETEMAALKLVIVS
eukprot:4535555-Karenia_brevis.AAC.1